MGSPDTMLTLNRSEISIQEKFITRKNNYTETLKMRILKRYVYSNYIRYTCMDKHRNQIEVIQSKLNTELLDAIFFSYNSTTEIYTNNPNFEEDVNKADAIAKMFNN